MKTKTCLINFVIIYALGWASLPALADTVAYCTDFSTDPGWVTDQASNYHWNEPMGSYFVHNTNTYPGYYPNRYAGKTMEQPVGSFELQWDVQVTRCDWSAGLYFGIWDRSLREWGWGYGGEFIFAVIGRADCGHVIAFEVGANGAGAEEGTCLGWSLNGWYTFKVGYDSDTEVANLEVLDRASAESIWSSTLAVPGGGFTKDLQFLGSNLGMVGSHGYSGISPSAVLEANLDNVVLCPEPPSHDPWSFVHMTDTHIGYTEKECIPIGSIIYCWEVASARDRLAAAIDQILEEVKSGTKIKPDFILVTGDIADIACDISEKCTEFYKDFILAVQRALYQNISVITVPGNHDRAQPPLYGLTCACGLCCYFNGLVGIERYGNACSFEHKGLHFIGLDSGDGNIKGEGLSDSQYGLLDQWGRDYPCMPKILFMHHPPVDPETDDGDQSIARKEGTVNGRTINLFDWCEDNKVLQVLAGHTHQDHVCDRNAVEPPADWRKTLYVQTPSVGKDPPCGYRWVNVTYTSPLGAYPETYSGIRDDSDRISACLYSPGSLHMYNLLGEHTGMTTSGEAELSIPRSYYFGHHVVSMPDGDEIFPEKIVVFGQANDHLYEVIGSETGTYRVEIKSVQEGGEIAFRATDVPTSPGERHVYTVDWAALSAGEEGITLNIDADGDDIFERTVIADEDLTSEEFALQTETVIDFEPDVLNLANRAKVVTAYIELPEGFDVSAIDVSTIKLNDVVSALSRPTAIEDHDEDGVPDLMVKFDCAQVAKVLEAGRQVVTLTGRLAGGTLFAGIDTIRVIGSGSAAATEPQLEVIVPQESVAPKQGKPAAPEADAADTGASESFDVKEGVAFMLSEVCQAISELGPENFDSEESAIELTTTIDAMFTMLDDGLYFEALAVLDSDVLQRTDGCANTGQPDEDDWVRSVEGQALVYPLVVETIELLESLL